MNYIPFLVESNWLFWSKVGRPLLSDSYWDSSAVGYCWGMSLFGCFVWYHCIWYAVDFIYVQYLYWNECNIISSNVLRTVQTSIHRTNLRDHCSSSRQLVFVSSQQCKYMNFIYLKSLFITWMVYLDSTYWPAPSWLVSSVGRRLHRYCRGHGFKSRTVLNFFQVLFSTTSSVVFLASRIS